MSHLTIQRKSKTIKIPMASVQDVIDLMDASYTRRRKELADDMREMEIDDAGRIKALNELRERKGMTTDLIRETFTLPGAHAIIRHMADPENLEDILEEAPDEIVELALKILGFEVGEESADETKEEDDSSHPEKGGGTSTMKL